VALDYYTEPQSETEIQILSETDQSPLPSPSRNNTGLRRDEMQTAEVGEKGWGEIQVTTQVVGFKKLRWFTRENLGEEALDLPPTELQTTGYWVSLSEGSIETLRANGSWTNDANDYGPDWPLIRVAVRTRDGFRCQVCGLPEAGREHDVHHKIPFRAFMHERVAAPADIGVHSAETLRLSVERANRLDNLITLCPTCHHKAEQNVRIRSGLAGLSYVLSQLAPLFLMCDPSDLGVHTDAVGAVRASHGMPANAEEARPSIFIYDQVPAGIGFSEKLFELHDELIARALELVTECECKDGCPSCVGPGGENGLGGKLETIEILKVLCGKS
jgi:DEAD/DEAH box helicase domain-containing protein